MDNHSNFKTFLFISSKNFIISVNETTNFKSLYEKKMNYQNNFEELDIIQLDVFLKENIFEIEKNLNSFVKNITLIIDINLFQNLSISMKKNNNNKVIKFNEVNYLLNDAKEQCKISFKEKRIIHMIIDNYKLNNKDFPYLPEDISCDFFSLDITFMCLPNKIIKDLEKVFEKYHISISKIINAKYMKSLFKDEKQDLFLMARDISEGFNKNEVVFTPKTKKNSGFFEKFFHFFS